MKQLLKLAQVRGKTAVTNEAIILALLVAWALLQPEVTLARQLLSQAGEQWPITEHHASAPQEASRADVQLALPTQTAFSSWTMTALSVQTLRQQVQGSWTLARLHVCWPYLRRFLSHRPRRPHQESTMRRHLVARLSPPTASSSSLFFCSSA